MSLPKTKRKITLGFEVFTSPSVDLFCFLQEPLAHYEKKWCYRDSRQASVINIKTFDFYMESCKLNLQKMFFYTLLVYCWFNTGCFRHWKLRTGNLLFGGHSRKSLHCSVCPNCLKPNCRWPIAKALNLYWIRYIPQIMATKSIALVLPCKPSSLVSN